MVRIVIVIVITGLLVSSCGQDSTRLNTISPQSTIVAFGDSLTEGVGASSGQSYPDFLSRLIGNNVINEGISGEISENGLKRLPAILEEYRPDLVIICHGGNDLLRKLSLGQAKENLREMIMMIEATQAKIVIIAVPEFSLFGGALPMYQELAEEFDLPLENKALVRLLKSKKMKSDTVHLNNEGYKALANDIYKLLKEEGANL